MVDPFLFALVTNWISDGIAGVLRSWTMSDSERRALAEVARGTVVAVADDFPEHGDPISRLVAILLQDPDVVLLLLGEVLDGRVADFAEYERRLEAAGLDASTAPISPLRLVMRIREVFRERYYAEAGRPGSVLVNRLIAADAKQRAMGAEHATANLRDYLQRLPPELTELVTEAIEHDPRHVEQLVVELTSQRTRPAEVLQRWLEYDLPGLAEAPWRTLTAAGELAAAYGVPELGGRLITAALGRGAARRQFWSTRAFELHRAAGLPDAARQVIAHWGSAEPITDPYTEAVVQLRTGDRAAAFDEAYQWRPVAAHELMIRAGLLWQICIPTLDNGLQWNDHADKVLRVFRDTWHATGSPTAGLGYVSLRIAQPRRGRDDIDEIYDLALQLQAGFRHFRGDEGPAVLIACRAAAALDRWSRVVAIGAEFVGSASSHASVAASEVNDIVAVGAIEVGQYELAADCIARVTSRSARMLLHGRMAHTRGENPDIWYQNAVDQAGDVGELIAAVGHRPQPDRLEELAEISPKHAAVIEARKALAQHDAEKAIRLLRPHASEVLDAAMILASAYEQVGDVERVVTTLVAAAEQFHDYDLQFSAAEVLAEQGETERAAALLVDLLGQHLRTELRRNTLALLANLAGAAGRYDDAARRLRAILELNANDQAVRWELIQLCCRRGDMDAARTALRDAPEPLTPRDPGEAACWVRLNRDDLSPQQWASACLKLLARFSGVEFQIFIFEELAPLQDDQSISLDLLTRLDDAQRALAESLTPDKLTELVISNPERDRLCAAWIDHGLALDTAPLEVLAAFSRAPLAEIAIVRSEGFLRIHVDGPDELAASMLALVVGVGADVVVDTTTLLTLTVLGRKIADHLTSNFDTVLVTEETMTDAVNARHGLAPRMTWRAVWDDEARTLAKAEVSAEEAARYATEAAGLAATAQRYKAASAPHTKTDALNGHSPATAVPIALAAARRCTLWSDDPAVRVLARSLGISTVSTICVLDFLLTGGHVDAPSHEAALRSLIRQRMGDVPFDPSRLMEMAAQDDWAAGPVATVLAQPAAWRDRRAAHALYRSIIRQAAQHRPDQLPAWLGSAVTGADEELEAARLLADTMLESIGRLDASDLVEASRVGSADPLPAAVRLIRDELRNHLSEADAARMTMTICGNLAPSDLAVATQELLTV